jgi:DNA-binding CsgD family transcriptional regulator
VGVEQDILERSQSAGSVGEYREGVLRALRDELGADVALFGIGGGPSQWSALGMDAVLPTLFAGLAAYGEEVAGVQRVAQRLGATTDRAVLGGSLERTRIFREVMAPLRGHESLFLVPEFRGQKLGFVILGRTGRRRFSESDLARARLVAPVIGVSCAALSASLDRRRPETFGLSPRKLELLEYLELGYTTREIATACGTSAFTVRNQLSALYRQLGVSNCAEAAGLRARRR